MYSIDENLKIDSLDDLPEIRPFPEIATRILQACNSPESTANDLCEVIRCDPAISMKVMRVANSSAYGMGGQVTTLKRAIVVLGFRSLKNLALSVAAGDVFKGSGKDAVYYQRLWQQSIACATVARQVARETNLACTDEAFLAGIVHDVGKLVFMDLAAESYHQVTEVSKPNSIVNVENELFGINHQELGLRCADEWGLPFEIAEAIGTHHSAFEQNDNPELSNLVGLAESLCRYWGVGGDAQQDEELEDIIASCSVAVDLETIQRLEEDVHTEFQELLSAFND